MAWYHTSKCDCPIGCCSCGDSEYYETKSSFVYDIIEEKIVEYFYHLNREEGDIFMYDDRLLLFICNITETKRR